MSQTGQPVAGCSMQYAPEKNSFHIWAGWSPCIFFHEWMTEWMTISAEIWSYCKIPAIWVSQGTCVYTRGISVLLGKQCSALGKEGVGIKLLPSRIGKPEMYLQILIIRLENTEVRLEAALVPLWELEGRRVHEPVTLTSWNSKYARPKTPGWDMYGLGGRLSSSPSCWDLQCWDRFHVDFNHSVPSGQKDIVWGWDFSWGQGKT